MPSSRRYSVLLNRVENINEDNSFNAINCVAIDLLAANIAGHACYFFVIYVKCVQAR